jgi:mRNA interferase HigB
VRIIKPKRVKAWAGEYPDAAGSLWVWLEIATRADWASIDDVRQQYPHADGVKVRSGETVTVFNIGGNKYRLVVAIKYPWRTVYVLRFLTHAQYGKGRWKDQL